MLAVLAWLTTNIFWVLTAKEPSAASSSASPAVDTEPRRVAQTLIARHLFGEVVNNTPAAAAAPIDLQLTGVIAAQRPGETAMAFLTQAGKPTMAVREGQEVVPGITLAHVLPRQVELSVAGATQVLTLPEPNKAAQAGGKPAPQAGGAPQTPAAAPAAPPPVVAMPPVNNNPAPSRRYRQRHSSSAED